MSPTSEPAADGTAESPAARVPDEVLDQQPDEIVDRAASVGRERLDRGALDVLITGFIGGIEVSLGGLAAMAVVGSVLGLGPRVELYAGLALGGLVFPIGFLFVILGRSELFTENFLIPVVAVFNQERSIGSLLQVWSLSLVGNLLGCLIMAVIFRVPEAIGKPIMSGYVAYSAYKLALPPVAVLTSAILAGLVMTVLTWLLLAIVNPVGKILLIFAAGYVLFAANLSHVVVSASMLFTGYSASHHSLLEVVVWLAIATAGNLIGGIGFVTFFRLVQAREKQRQGQAT